MISKGRYKQAEVLLRKIAKTNKRTFDEEAFQQLKNEQEKVRREDFQGHIRDSVLSLNRIRTINHNKPVY
jgi:hypothetical protein